MVVVYIPVCMQQVDVDIDKFIEIKGGQRRDIVTLNGEAYVMAIFPNHPAYMIEYKTAKIPDKEEI